MCRACYACPLLWTPHEFSYYGFVHFCGHLRVFVCYVLSTFVDTAASTQIFARQEVLILFGIIPFWHIISKKWAGAPARLAKIPIYRNFITKSNSKQSCQVPLDMPIYLSTRKDFAKNEGYKTTFVTSRRLMGGAPRAPCEEEKQ